MAGFREYQVSDNAVAMGRKLGLQEPIADVIHGIARHHVPTRLGPRLKRCGIFAIEIVDGEVTKFGLGPPSWQTRKPMVLVRQGRPEFVE